MILYHGSYVAINTIDLTQCAAGKDFGKGFYLTDSLSQARSFIKTSLIKAKSVGRIPKWQNYGYVTAFRYRTIEDDVPVYRFDTADKEWLWFVSINRRSELAKEFGGLLPLSLLEAEIVVGK